MESPTETGYKIYVAWIPTKFAVVNKIITIDSMPGNWIIKSTSPAISIDDINLSRSAQKAFADKLADH